MKLGHCTKAAFTSNESATVVTEDNRVHQATHFDGRRKLFQLIRIELSALTFGGNGDVLKVNAHAVLQIKAPGH
jgi:hypothetical protein